MGIGAVPWYTLYYAYFTYRKVHAHICRGGMYIRMTTHVVFTGVPRIISSVFYNIKAAARTNRRDTCV